MTVDTVNHMYSIHAFGKMIGDKVRTDAYYEALQRVVKPDSVVVDIGAGTGIFSLLACRLGARHVYAIEPANPIIVARELAAANGMSDRITFIQEVSTRVTLPEKADVIVSDLRGTLPVFQSHIRTISDARQRFLADGGTLIPEKDVLLVALVSASDDFEDSVRPWGTNDYGLDLEPAIKYLRQQWRQRRVSPDAIVSEPRVWATLDYQSVTDTSVSGEVRWIVDNPGLAHGFAVWFEAHPLPGISYTTDPREPERVYGSAYFPWESPVELAEGDEVKLNISAHLVGRDHIWRWETDIRQLGASDTVKVRFSQSNFFSEPMLAGRLAGRDRLHRPSLNDDGLQQLTIMRLMDGQHTNERIAEIIYEQSADYFRDLEDALELVREIAMEYSTGLVNTTTHHSSTVDPERV